MEKPHTDLATMTFVGPDINAQRARKTMLMLGFSESRVGRPAAGAAIPWRESRHFSQVEELPGLVLSGARYREGLTQAQLAGRAGIQRRHISEMEGGKRSIGKINAHKLAAALNIDPRRLLTL